MNPKTFFNYDLASFCTAVLMSEERERFKGLYPFVTFNFLSHETYLILLFFFLITLYLLRGLEILCSCKVDTDVNYGLMIAMDSADELFKTPLKQLILC